MKSSQLKTSLERTFMCMLLGLETFLYLVVFKYKWLLKDQIQTTQLSTY
jgi:hypothetical protein